MDFSLISFFFIPLEISDSDKDNIQIKEYATKTHMNFVDDYLYVFPHDDLDAIKRSK